LVGDAAVYHYLHNKHPSPDPQLGPQSTIDPQLGPQSTMQGK